VEFKNFGYQISSFEVEPTVVLEGANLPPYLFVFVCVIVRMVFLSNDVHFGCILSHFDPQICHLSPQKFEPKTLSFHPKILRPYLAFPIFPI
jgi:hypothetical protein